MLPMLHLPIPLPRRGKTVAQAAGALAALSAAGMLTVAYFFVEQLTRPQPRDPARAMTFTPWELDLPFETVAFPTQSGGHQVGGWWLPQASADRVVIACSGYRRGKADLLGIGKQLWQAGNTVLLIDLYGHGSDPGVPITLGHREVGDFLGAVDYVAGRAPGAAIGAVGYSMGAAVAIMGAARDPRVRAVVADSPFATHRGVAEHFLRQIMPNLPPDPLLNVMDPLLGWRAGYRFHEVEPLREVGQLAPRPLLLIHGTADAVIPARESEALFAAAGAPKDLWIVPEALHCGAYFVDRRAYSQRVRAFFDRALAPAAAGERAAHALD